MNRMIASVALAAALITSVPVVAQPAYNRGSNGNEFWRGAPRGVWERIQFLEQRIDHGVRDGSLTRNEARRAEMQLHRIRQDASRMRRNGLTRSESATLQARLDNVSRNLRWMRRNERNAGYDDRYRTDYDDRYRTDYDDRYRTDYDDRYRTDYDAARYYRDGNYSERRLGANDEIYRGSDGRYYCKRSDGTTGLIVGAAAGGLLGNVVDGGDNRLGGTLIGGALGALLGREIDRSSDDVRCR